MANNYFQFKQFTVQQQHCAMKVSTDACIFGAVVAKTFSDKGFDEICCCLDIGTGTGLLSLMLAQKTTTAIDAVEIDLAAFEQAKENFAASPFTKQLTVYHADVLQFGQPKEYNGIVCNPPFFEGDLPSDNAMKNAAKHSTTFTLQQLLHTAKGLLKADGLLAVLLPYHRVIEFIDLAAKSQLFVQQRVLLRHTALHSYSRGILFLSATPGIAAGGELVIKNHQNNYTDELVALLKDYYLHL